jgi:predicted RecB family nuclease
MSKEAILSRDNGTRNMPGTDSPWRAWVSATRTRNFCNYDPLLDWLEEYGEARGFAKDTTAELYDSRTDFLQFVLNKGNEFEAAILRYLAGQVQLKRIAWEAREVRDPAVATRTWEAMRAGVEAIAQGVLWNPETQTYGAADLLLRSDVLAKLFPGSIPPGEATIVAPGIPGARWHYRVVDIKFMTLHMLKDGHAASQHRDYMAQVWLYNEALGRIQGMVPPCGYLLGRGWEQLKERGSSAMERLERVDRDFAFGRKDISLRELALGACEWIRRMREAGGKWAVLPEPSVDELRPNMRYMEDAPWHLAKQRIAAHLEDLTLLPRVTPQLRQAAITAGLRRWTDPACSAESLGISGETLVPLVNAVIVANHSPADGKVVIPDRVTASEQLWRTTKTAEFYVDFETVSDLDDDFGKLPQKGGQPLIFMIGCGYLTNPSDPQTWTFKVFTAERLTPDEERRVISEWLANLRSVCAERKTNLEESRLFHWSPAEVSTLTTAYNSAASRHGLPSWDRLPWVDLLSNVVKKQPVTVRGAFGFGLKAVAKAMHQAGLIPTNWGDGPTDGLGAMVGAWWCNREAAGHSTSMRDLDLMKSIEAYNEVDCRVMAEVLHFLRTQR